MIEGAAEGAGLGIRFLKHLTRTRLLLHIVDLSSVVMDGEDNPVDAIKQLQHEIAEFSPALTQRKQWLVLNKTDLLDDEALSGVEQEVKQAFPDADALHLISTVTRQGLDQLVHDLMIELETVWRAEEESEELREQEFALQQLMQQQGRERITELANRRREARIAARSSGSSDDDDWDDVDVEYVHD